MRGPELKGLQSRQTPGNARGVSQVDGGLVAARNARASSRARPARVSSVWHPPTRWWAATCPGRRRLTSAKLATVEGASRSRRPLAARGRAPREKGARGRFRGLPRSAAGHSGPVSPGPGAARSGGAAAAR